MKLGKYLVNEMTAREVEYENHEDAVLKIKNDCRKYVNLLGGKHPFYRGVNYSLYSSNSYLRVKARKDRRSLIGSRRIYGPVIDKLFDENNIPLRSRSVNVTSNLKHATFFSNNVYYFFPIGNFNFAFCRSKDFNKSGQGFKIFDFFKYLNSISDLTWESNLDAFWEKFGDYEKKRAWSFLKDGIITNKGMQVAHDNGFEIWFDCKEYYLIDNKSILADYWNQLMVKGN